MYGSARSAPMTSWLPLGPSCFLARLVAPRGISQTPPTPLTWGLSYASTRARRRRIALPQGASQSAAVRPRYSVSLEQARWSRSQSGRPSGLRCALESSGRRMPAGVATHCSISYPQHLEYARLPNPPERGRLPPSQVPGRFQSARQSPVRGHGPLGATGWRSPHRLSLQS